MLSHFASANYREQNMGVATDTSEFSYLPGQAQALGVPLPIVERISTTLPDGRMLSALRYGEEPPVVTLLHGAGLNAHTWDATALLLGVPALAIDLPGHGDSSWRDDADYAPRGLAADVAVGLRAWTNVPQLVVGHSLGGLTGAALAAAEPALVSALVIVDITPGVDTTAGPAALREFYAGGTDFASRDEMLQRAMSFGLGGSREDTERGVLFNSRIRSDGRVEWKHHFAHLAGDVLAAAPARTAVDELHEGGWQDLEDTAAPITLMRAANGFVSEADADEFREHVPAASVVIADAGHNVQETAPAALAELVRRTLAQRA